MCTGDVLTAGDVINLDNSITLPRNPTQIRFDGRDHIGSNFAVVMTRAAWATSPGTVLAGAVEVYAVNKYGTQFEIPIGEDVASGDQNQMFQYTDMHIMAAQDGTTVAIDADADGGAETNIVLNQGESYHVSGGVNVGATVSSSAPVQVDVITGDIGSRYESRWLTMYPVGQWSDSYYTPVGTASDGDQAYVFLYNPNGAGITVNYETRVSSGSFAIASGNYTRFLMPQDSGARFWTDTASSFFAIEAVGARPSSNLVHDWGFSLVPEGNLTPEVAVGWGPGSDPNNPPLQDGSPVWVTTTGDTTIYVDFDGDGGGNTAPNGQTYDQSYNVNQFDSLRIYDPGDKDNTATRIFSADGTLITAAWGQDPAQAGPGNPFLDLGTSVLPFPIPAVEKQAEIINDDGDGLLDVGGGTTEFLRYTITLNNEGVIPISGINLQDVLPTGSNYTVDSTTLNGVLIADSGTTPFPLDETGLSIPEIASGANAVIVYDITPDLGASGTFLNSVTVSTSQGTLETETPIELEVNHTMCSAEFTDSGGSTIVTIQTDGDAYVTVGDNDQNTNPGTAQTVTATVRNTTGGDLESLTLIETGLNTGVFRNASALPTSVTNGLGIEDGTLNAQPGDALEAGYIDPVVPGDSCSDTITIVVPSEIKQLYLSTDGSGDPDQDLDRIDPVANTDATTASSDQIGGGENVADNFDPSTVFMGNDGTQNFIGDWTQFGETDGATNGVIRVGSVANFATCPTGECMVFGGVPNASIDGKGLYREMNLQGSSSANLSLNYRRRTSTAGSSVR